MTADELRKLRGEAQDRLKSIHAAAEKESRDMTDDEVTAFEAASDELKGLDARIKRSEIVEATDEMPGRRTVPPPIMRQDDLNDPDQMRSNHSPQPVRKATIEIPQNVRTGSLKGYTRERFGDDYLKRAYSFGRMVYAHLGHEQSRQWCNDHGIDLRVHTEGTNWQGGVLVLDQFDSDLIRLVESYGVFRQFARVVPMMSDVMQRDRRTGGLTAYAVGEDSAGTESTMS